MIEVGKLPATCRAIVAKYGKPCEREAAVWVGHVPLCEVHFPAVQKAFTEPVVRTLSDAIARAVTEALPQTMPPRSDSQ